MRRAEDDLKRRGISYAALHATSQGEVVYEKAGWSATNEMGKPL